MGIRDFLLGSALALSLTTTGCSSSLNFRKETPEKKAYKKQERNAEVIMHVFADYCIANKVYPNRNNPEFSCTPQVKAKLCLTLKNNYLYFKMYKNLFPKRAEKMQEALIHWLQYCTRQE